MASLCSYSLAFLNRPPYESSHVARLWFRLPLRKGGFSQQPSVIRECQEVVEKDRQSRGDSAAPLGLPVFDCLFLGLATPGYTPRLLWSRRVGEQIRSAASPSLDWQGVVGQASCVPGRRGEGLGIPEQVGGVMKRRFRHPSRAHILLWSNSGGCSRQAA